MSKNEAYCEDEKDPDYRFVVVVGCWSSVVGLMECGKETNQLVLVKEIVDGDDAMWGGIVRDVQG